MVFILVDLGPLKRDFVLPNQDWSCIVEEVQGAGLLPDNVAELIRNHLCTPLSPDDTHTIASFIASQPESKFLSDRFTADELDRLIAFLKQSKGIEVC